MAGNGSRKPGSWRRAREVRSLRLPPLVESPSGKAPSCNLGTKRFDSALDLRAPKVFLAARWLAKSEERVQSPLGAPTPAPLSERLGPGLPNRRREFDSRTVLFPRRPAIARGERHRGPLRAPEALMVTRLFRNQEKA